MKTTQCKDKTRQRRENQQAPTFWQVSKCRITNHQSIALGRKVQSMIDFFIEYIWSIKVPIVFQSNSCCSDIKLYDLAPATRPAAWPAECGLTSIFAGWAQAGLCTGRRSLWSAALLPGDPLLPVGADQRGALAGGETSVGAGARLWRLRGQGSVRARARWRGSVWASWTSRHGRGGQEEGEEEVVEQHDCLLNNLFGWREEQICRWIQLGGLSIHYTGLCM